MDVTNIIDYPSTYASYDNVNTHYLTEGDSIDFTTGIFNLNASE